MRTYLRNRTPGGVYFFTVNLAQRNGNTLLTENIGALHEAFRCVLKDHPVAVEAMVVLPDHLHCLWRMPEGDHAHGMRWPMIKARFSMTVAGGEQRSASRLRKGERGIWQRRYWEHLTRDDGDFARHVDYIHYNPVKHGHAARAADWPYSTFMRWVKRGAYAEDWAGS